MLQNTSFSGQPIFAQIVGLINKAGFNQLVKDQDANRYCKRCGAWEHLVSMLYCVTNNCMSIREVTKGMAGYGDKLNHLGVNYIPPRSTFSEANSRRSEAFFGSVYSKLFLRYREGLADSQKEKVLNKRLFLIDSTTISLFKDIMKCVGRKRTDGKSKGGIKVHTMLNAYDEVPQLIHFTDATVHDHTFLSQLQLKAHQIAVFDRAYVDYKQYAKWTSEDVHFVTRLKDNAAYEQLEEMDISDHCSDGYIKDQTVSVAYKDDQKQPLILTLRRVVYYDEDKDKVLQFLTNIMDMEAEQIGLIYKKRWQIELLFKQLKQNFPLKYFLGDNENAIKIQIWCTLIANLLLTIVHRSLKQTISFSNMVSILRQHLFSYHKIIDLIERTEMEWRKKYQDPPLKVKTLFD